MSENQIVSEDAQIMIIETHVVSIVNETYTMSHQLIFGCVHIKNPSS